MGRIKTMFIKRITKTLFAKHKDEYTEDFKANKELVEKHATFHSKKMRNVVAGYVTRLRKNEDVL